MKNIGVSRLVATLLVGLALVLVSCTAAPAPSERAEGPKQEPKPQLTKLVSSYSSIDASYIPLWVTKEAGLFEKNGLDVELLLIEGSQRNVQGLIAGDIKVANVGGAEAVSAGLAGVEVVQIATSAPVLPYKLVTIGSISSPQDLKGKSLGISGFGSSSHFGTLLALRRMGLKPDEDVALVVTGGTGTRLAAMQAGAIHGAVLSPPVLYQIEQFGFKVLADLSDLDLSIEQAGLVVTRKFMSENDDVVRRFVRAFIEGIHYFKTQKEFSLKVYEKYTKIDNRGALEEAYEYYAKKATARVPYVTEKGMRNVLEGNKENPKAAIAKISDFYDNRFVKELDDSGFIKRLYGE